MTILLKKIIDYQWRSVWTFPPVAASRNATDIPQIALLETAIAVLFTSVMWMEFRRSHGNG